MRTIRALCLRVANLLARRRHDRDFADELNAHLQLHIDDNLRAGMTPGEARRAAVIALGGIAQTTESYRDRRGLPLVDALRQDVVYAVRVLRKNPAFTATAVLTLALGIGANSAIFSVVNAVLLRPLPFTDPGRLVLIFSTAKDGNRHDVSTYPDYADWRNQNRSFSDVAAYANRSMTIGIGDESVVAQGKRVTTNVFDVLGVQPALGRTFRPEENRPGSNTVVILSDQLWQRRFGGSPNVLGQTIRINEEPYTIVGVMPPTFQIDDWERFYIPLPIDPSRGHGFLRVVGRLHPGVTLQQAQSDLGLIAGRLATIYPKSNQGVDVNLMSLTAGLVGEVRFGFYLMLGVVAVVLVIACANVAGLMLARGATRQRELAVRSALGAGRGRLTRQLLTESLLIAAAGGLLGLLLANWTARSLATLLSEQFQVPRVVAASTDFSVLLFTVLVAAVTGITFGAFPAFASASPDLNEALRDASRSATGARAPRVRSGLVVLETALALVLLAGAGTLLKTFLSLRTTHPGFETSHVLALDLWLPQPRFAQRDARAGFYEDALTRVQALPGVRSAAFVADLPLNGGTDSQGFHIVGRPDPAPGKTYSAGFNIATARYFETMGIPVRAGREFADSDRATTTPVIVINETAARRFWPEGSPLGRQIDLPISKNTSVVLTVVGVTADVRHVGLAVPPRPEIFVNSMQSSLPWSWLVLAVRAHGDPAPLAESVKAALHDVNANVPIERANTLDEVVSRSIVGPRVYTFLLGTFAALAVMLAAIGLYGLISYTVSQRTHELGVRVALGAARSEIVRLVLGQGLRLAAVGAAIGLAGAFATTRLVASLVKNVEPNDPATFAIVTIVLLTAALLAAYLPARRASRVDPMVALRAD
jgi:putative ABC transport system permease protein